MIRPHLHRVCVIGKKTLNEKGSENDSNLHRTILIKYPLCSTSIYFTVISKGSGFI